MAVDDTFVTALNQRPLDVGCSRPRLIHHATSLGAVESTMERGAARHAQSICRGRCCA